MSTEITKGIWTQIVAGEANAAIYHVSGGAVAYVQDATIPLVDYNDDMKVVGATSQGEDGLFIVGAGEFIYAWALNDDAKITLTEV